MYQQWLQIIGLVFDAAAATAAPQVFAQAPQATDPFRRVPWPRA